MILYINQNKPFFIENIVIKGPNPVPKFVVMWFVMVH